MFYKFLAIPASFLIAIAAFSAGNLAVTKYAEVNAPAAVVWAKVKDFNALNGWHPAVAKDEIVEGENNQVGAVRLLTLGDGGTIREKLLVWDDAGMNLTYNILEGVLPVSDYESTIKVETISDTSSKVTWTGSFNHGNGADDQAAMDAISGVYQGGLDNLQKIMDGQQ